MNQPQISDPQVEVVDNLSRERFELWSTGPEKLFYGFLGYRITEPGVLDLQHVIIDEQYGRRGYARALVTLVLDELRERNQKIIPTCSYVEDYLERFPQYADLRAAT